MVEGDEVPTSMSAEVEKTGNRTKEDTPTPSKTVNLYLDVVMIVTFATKCKQCFGWKFFAWQFYKAAQ